MSKGGYNGGSTVVGFSGSGWVGRGSVTMQPASGKKAPKHGESKPRKQVIPSVPADLASDGDIQRDQQRIAAIEADLKAARNRVQALEQRLRSACDDLGLSVANAKRAKQRASGRPQT